MTAYLHGELAPEAKEVFEAQLSGFADCQESLSVGRQVSPAFDELLAADRRPRMAFDAMALLMKEIHVIGSMTYNRPGPRSDFELAVEMLAQHPERFRGLITHRFPLEQIARGFEAAADKGCGSIKVLIEPRRS